MASLATVFVQCSEDKAHKMLPRPGDLVEVVTVADSDREGSIMLLSSVKKGTRIFKARLVACRASTVSY